MNSQLQPIFIPQLTRAPERTDVLQVHEYLPDLDTLMPVQGVMRVIHQQTYLDVAVEAETIVTLACDRCLQQYNHRLRLKSSELIWLSTVREDSDTSNLVERETLLEDLVESLPPDGYFDPAAWLYEQLCLALPQRQLCSETCPGIPVNPDTQTSSSTLDHRWAALANLKSQIEIQEDA